jgi:hypothetical protein
LYIYLTHWQIYPYLERDHPLAALVASVGLGLLYWFAWSRATAGLSSRFVRSRGDGFGGERMLDDVQPGLPGVRTVVRHG